MKGILLIIGLTASILASSFTQNSIVTLPERIDENGVVHKEQNVSYQAALIDMENYNKKEKHARNECIIDGKISYFDLSSEKREETKYSIGHTYLGYGDFFTISGVKMVSGSKAHFWISNAIPKQQIIKHTMNKLKKDYLYLDFRKTPRVEIVNEKILEYLYSQIGIIGAIKLLKENAVSFMLNHKTTITLKTPLVETSTELFSDASIAEEEKLMRYLDMLNVLGSDLDKIFFVVLDEFQDIKKIGSSEYDILEMLRGTLQHHDNICYIFAGSNMTIMTEIFEDSNSGFFNSCRKLKLKPFDIDEVHQELIKAFKTVDVVFDDDDDLRAILQRLSGHPANTMLVMQNIEILSMQKDVKLLSKKDIEDSYTNAFEESSDLISEYLKEIKSKEHLHDVIYRTAKNEEQILSSNSLLQKRTILLKMGYIAKVEIGVYEIVDGFLKEELISE